MIWKLSAELQSLQRRFKKFQNSKVCFVKKMSMRRRWSWTGTFSIQSFSKWTTTISLHFYMFSPQCMAKCSLFIPHCIIISMFYFAILNGEWFWQLFVANNYRFYRKEIYDIWLFFVFEKVCKQFTTYIYSFAKDFIMVQLRQLKDYENCLLFCVSTSPIQYKGKKPLGNQQITNFKWIFFNYWGVQEWVLNWETWM